MAQSKDDLTITAQAGTNKVWLENDISITITKQFYVQASLVPSPAPFSVAGLGTRLCSGYMQQLWKTAKIADEDISS